MRKFFIIFLIFFLILSTTIVKNSSKNIEDEIFIVKENIRNLDKKLGNIKLEYEYLSSSEKLIEFHSLYFDEKLKKKDIQEIKVISKKSNKLDIKKLKILNGK